MRTFVLPDVAVAILRRRRRRQAAAQLAAGEAWRETGAVFTLGDGGLIHPDNATKATIRLTERALGRRLSPHSLRHSAATFMAMAGVPVKAAQEMLGHADPSITMSVYTHVLAESRSEAAVALDGLFGGAA